jgi:hypothetical protein
MAFLVRAPFDGIRERYFEIAPSSDRACLSLSKTGACADAGGPY